MKNVGEDERSGDICVTRRNCLRMAMAGVAFMAGLVNVPVSARNAVIRSFNLDIYKRRIAKSLRTLRVDEGERVVINWTTDEAVEVHLHGYDIELQLAPGTTGAMDFVAKATGRYPINAHGFGHRALAYLEVQPK